MLIIYRVLLLLFLVTLGQMARAESNSEYLILAQISADEAARRVVRSQNDRVLGVRKAVVNGREVYIIKVLSPDKGRVRQYKVDAKTGQVL